MRLRGIEARILWRSVGRVARPVLILLILIVWPHSSKSAEEFSLGRVLLPGKQFTPHLDGSIEMTGHWKLKVVEDPVDPDGKFPIAAQSLNSTVIRCWPSKRVCEEYRAQIGFGLLFPIEPARFEIASWRDGRILATEELPANQEVLLRIDSESEHVEMEYRREPSPGRSRVFERWVLE